MLSVLFWNLNKKDLAGRVAALARVHRPAILALAESGACTDAILLGRLNRSPTHYTATEPGTTSRIRVFARHDLKTGLSKLADHHHYSLWTLDLPGIAPILLVVAHLPSKLYRSDISQHDTILQMAGRIRETERGLGHERTILLGDLNVNPFEPAMVSAFGLHAVSTRATARAGSRIVDQERWPYFYNPGWQFLGDADHERHPPGHAEHKPAGTCHFPASGPVWYHWNVFDQALVRPTLFKHIGDASVRVLSHDGIKTLLDADGRPDRLDASDHLPLLLELHS